MKINTKFWVVVVFVLSSGAANACPGGEISTHRSTKDYVEISVSFSPPVQLHFYGPLRSRVSGTGGRILSA